MSKHWPRSSFKKISEHLRNISNFNIREKASVAELFFDIILVVYVGGISHNLINSLASNAFDWQTIGLNIAEICFALYIWKIFMFHSSGKFQGMSYRYSMFLLMTSLMMLGIASFFNIKNDDTIILMFTGYLLVILSISSMRANSSNYFSIFQKSTYKESWLLIFRMYIINLLIFSAIILSALCITFAVMNYSTIFRPMLTTWIGVNIALFIASIVLINKKVARKFTINGKLMSERLFILLILFFGEELITIVNIFAEENNASTIWNMKLLYIFIGFFIMFGQWWIIHDNLFSRPLKDGNFAKIMFVNTFIFFLFSLSLCYIGIGVAIKGSENNGGFMFAIFISIVNIILVFLMSLRIKYVEEKKYIKNKFFILWNYILLFLAMPVQILLAHYTNNIIYNMIFESCILLIIMTAEPIEYLYSTQKWIKNPQLYKDKLRKLKQINATRM